MQPVAGNDKRNNGNLFLWLPMHTNRALA